MADRFNSPLSGLRPGGFLNDIVLQAYERPPLSMPMDARNQTSERTYLGGSYETPLHSETLPLGMKYGTEEYDTWRWHLMNQRALTQGINTQVLPHGDQAREAMRFLNDRSWTRGEGSGEQDSFGRGYHRGVPAIMDENLLQLDLESDLWNRALGLPVNGGGR